MSAISDEELTSITRAIYSRYGIDFAHYEPVSFKRRVARIISRHGLENTLGLWRKMMSDGQFIFTFIDEITVGLTEMFRNAEFWLRMRSDILPQFYAKSRLNIWHAGCSTGEEVYSMAILLLEEDLIHKARVTATDLNNQAIGQAAAGTFSGAYLPAYQKNYAAAGGKRSLSCYYSLDGDAIRFNKINRQAFTFYPHNLVKDPMPGPFDIVFCRNVMIYFDDVLKMNVLRLFHGCLSPGGYFVIGYYDAMPDGYQAVLRTLRPQHQNLPAGALSAAPGASGPIALLLLPLRKNRELYNFPA
jgi:chemotaxis protein methyltransferase CheR